MLNSSRTTADHAKSANGPHRRSLEVWRDASSHRGACRAMRSIRDSRGDLPRRRAKNASNAAAATSRIERSIPSAIIMLLGAGTPPCEFCPQTACQPAPIDEDLKEQRLAAVAALDAVSRLHYRVAAGVCEAPRLCGSALSQAERSGRCKCQSVAC